MIDPINHEMLDWIINCDRICKCPENHINCLSAKEWVKNMIGVWEFQYEKRDIRDKSMHPATFPINLAKRVIQLFTHRGEVVLDCFNGSGTTLVACKDLERNGIGIDLNPDYCELAKERISFKPIYNYFCRYKLKWEVINDDVMNILDHVPENSIDLIFTSPPYANLLDVKRTNKSLHSSRRENERLGKNEQYSKNRSDLGLLEPNNFFERMESAANLLHNVLKPNKHLVINIMDFPPKAFVQPLLIKCIENASFKLKNILIWDKRNLVQRTGIFGYPSNYITLNACYEYVFDFIMEK